MSAPNPIDNQDSSNCVSAPNPIDNQDSSTLLNSINNQDSSTPSQSFSPIKFTASTTTKTTPPNEHEIVDDEISLIKRPAEEQRKTEPEVADLCNTPKRERKEGQPDFRARNFATEAKEQESNEQSPTKAGISHRLMTTESTTTTTSLNSTPQKAMVKSLSIEFEQRLASIHVSPKPKNSSPASGPRAMSPIRSVASQLSPVSKLNLNDESSSQDEHPNSYVIEKPNLVSPSKIASASISNNNNNNYNTNIDFTTSINTHVLNSNIIINNNNNNNNNNNINNNNNNKDDNDIDSSHNVSATIIPASASSINVISHIDNISSIAPEAVPDVPVMNITSSSNLDDHDGNNKKVEFLQYEIGVLQEKYEASLHSNTEMRAMLSEYEKTLAQFIDARRSRPDQHSSLEQLLADKKKLELELQTIQISYQNLHQRYDDMKGLQEQARINDATLRQSIQVLQQELATTVRTLDNTRRSYEEKLEKATLESKNSKETLELELSSAKAKLLKSELKISSLESAIESKSRENSELMTICDELIHKMDKRCT